MAHWKSGWGVLEYSFSYENVVDYRGISQLQTANLRSAGHLSSHVVAIKTFHAT